MTRNVNQTHCYRGHLLSGENLRIATRKGGKQERICRTCSRDRNRASKDRRKGISRPLADARERFLGKIERTASGCWEWQGYIDRHGYGRITINYKPHSAHRVGYELFVGPIPDGLVIDHLCRNRACVNPEHLEPVTNDENVRRGLRSPTKTHCVHGHEFTIENTRISASGRRRCLECERIRSRDYQQRKVAS